MDRQCESSGCSPRPANYVHVDPYLVGTRRRRCVRRWRARARTGSSRPRSRPGSRSCSLKPMYALVWLASCGQYHGFFGWNGFVPEWRRSSYSSSGPPGLSDSKCRRRDRGIATLLLELRDAPLEAPEERLDVERPARDALDQRLGRQLGAVHVDVRSASQSRSAPKLPLASSASRSWLVVVRVDELRGIEIADRVGRKVTELAERPVHVLQAAIARPSRR